MRGPSQQWPAWVCAVALVALAIATAPTSAASSSTVISVNVASATYLDAAGCVPATAGSTDLGVVLPGSSTISTGDCLVVFGSSNDTSMLRLSQLDGGGDAMVPGPVRSTLGMWALNGSLLDASTIGNSAGVLGSGGNAPTWSAGGPGRGQAITLDGNDYATIPTLPAYDVTSFTVDAWVRTTDTLGVIATRATGGCGGGAGLCQWELWLNGTGRLNIEAESGGVDKFATTANPINDGAWHHVAATADDATKELRVYVDGQQAGVDSNWAAGSIDTGAAPIVLGRNGGGTDYYVGDLDELRFQAGVRTPADIYRYYAGRVQDYADGSNDFDTSAATTRMFGVCLDSVATGATIDGSTFVPNAGCAGVDGVGWRALAPTSASATAKVAFASSGDNDASVRLRFGFRPSSTQPPGAYEAPVAFDVLAPSV